MNRNIASHNPAIRQDMANLITRVPEPTMSGPSPFLLIAHHGPQTLPPNNDGLPFTRHPHRGFETVTFIRHGALMHEDSRTGSRVVHAGGVQWMTAGSGVTHNESAPLELRRDGGYLEVLQLWVNLPSRLKGVAPNYVGLEASDIPNVSMDAGRVSVHVVAGRFGDTEGAMQSLTDTTMLTIEFNAGGMVTLPATVGRSIFLYVVEGTISIGGQTIEQHTRIEFDQGGDEITLGATDNAYVIYGHAPLIDEPVAARGPFVITTYEEVVEAVRDFQDGLYN